MSNNKETSWPEIALLGFKLIVIACIVLHVPARMVITIMLAGGLTVFAFTIVTKVKTKPADDATEQESAAASPVLSSPQNEPPATAGGLAHAGGAMDWWWSGAQPNVLDKHTT